MHGLLVASRLLFLPGGLVLYAIGVALGRGGGSAGSPLSPLSIALGALTVVAVHLVTHYVNDAEDVATDEKTENPTAFTGGSRAIQRGLVTPEGLYRASAVLGAGVVAIALYLLLASDPVGSLLQLAILVLGYAYSGRPFMLGRRGLGEIDTALVMGVLVPLSGAQLAGGVTPALKAAATLLFIQTFFARLCTAWPDVAPDRATSKWTIPALLGVRGASLAFGLTAIALAAATVFAAPLLPSAFLQRVVAYTFAAAMAGVAIVVGLGGFQRKPIVVPIISVLGYTASMTALMAGALFR